MKIAQCKTNRKSAHHSTVNHEKHVFFSARAHDAGSFFSPVTIQPKLKVGAPDDQYERQADRVAEAVVSSPAPTIQQQSEENNGEILQRKCAECEKDEGLQMKSSAGKSVGTAPPGISQKIQNAAGGTQLPDSVNSEMSQKIGADFSNVNVHTGPEASRLNQSLGARAFTHGDHIFFNSGEYNPGSRDGKRLLAHELTHVVQQGRNKTIRREPATAAAGTVTIGTVLGWCLSGAAVSVLIDQVIQAGGWVWERIRSGGWNIRQNWCKTIFSALFGCVFGMVSGPMARMIFGEVAGFSLAQLSTWIHQKLVAAGLTFLAGKWGVMIAKLGCNESDAPANIDAP